VELWLPAKAGRLVLGAGIAGLLLVGGGAAASPSDTGAANGNAYAYGSDNGAAGGGAGGNPGAQATSEQGDQPPGNNGTIKIHDLETPTSFHGNEPHVTCDFAVDFYGFDGWPNSSEMTFELWSPTQPAAAHPYTRHVDVTVTERVDGAQWDKRETFTADDILNGQTATPHPQQGYHVRLTVATTDSAPNGAIVKHKVFWMAPCDQEQETPPTRAGTTPTVNGTTGAVSSSAVTTAEVLGTSFEREGGAPATVPPAPQTAPAAATQVGPETSVLGLQLARTGSSIALLAGGGAALLALGCALTRIGRRRATA
jgi:hypothetical protein